MTMGSFKGNDSVHTPAGDIGSGFGPSGGSSSVPELTVHSPAGDLSGKGFGVSPDQAEFGDGYGMPGPERASTEGLGEFVQFTTGLPSAPSADIGPTNMADGLARSPKP